MSKAQKFYLMAAIALWGAMIYAVVWGLVSWLTNVPPTYEVTVGSFSITVNRWFDVILFPLYLNLILSVYLWLFPVLERGGACHDDLVTGLSAGLGLGFVAGIVAGFGAGLVTGLSAGLVTGLFAGLSAGLVTGFSEGLSAGFVAGLVAGLVSSLGLGIGVGLIAGLGVGLGVGLVVGLGALIVLVIRATV